MRGILMSLGLGVCILVLSMYSSTAAVTATFLQRGVNTRATAMGEAFVALADDSTSLYRNPAGLIQMERKEFSIVHNNSWCGNTDEVYLSVGFPVAGGILALAGDYVNAESADQITVFTPSGLGIIAGYGKRISGRFSLGFSVGMDQDIIGSEKENIFLANVGLLGKVSRALFFGFAVNNIGGGLGTSAFPLTLRTGLALRDIPFTLKSIGRSVNGKITMALDMVMPVNGSSYYCAGVAWWIEELVALRLGYKSNQEAGSGVTAGLGFKVGRLHLDYAHVDYGYFGITHRVSLGWKW